MSDQPAPKDPRDLVLEALRGKACMKQDIFMRTTAFFEELKEAVRAIATDLEEQAHGIDERLQVGYAEKNNLACELKVAGDIIVFNMHTNVFLLDQSHSLWRGGYLEEDGTRGYFGVVNMYNFLSDSMKFNRERDLGYLVARLFLNKEGHFLLQGKRQLGFLYNDLAGNVMTPERLKELLFTVINYVIEFDLLAPPYDQVNQVTVNEMNEIYANQQPSTGKRLGFRFQADVDDVT